MTRERIPHRRRITARLVGLTAVAVTATTFAVAPTPAFATETYSALDRQPVELVPADAAGISVPAPETAAADDTVVTSDEGPVTPDGGAAPSDDEGVVASGQGAPAPEPGSVSGDRLGTQATDIETFELIGVAVDTESPEDAFIRIHTDEGWGTWEQIELHQDAGPAADSDEAARALQVTGGHPVSEPIWVGDGDGYEINLPGDATNPEVLLVRERTRLASAPEADEGAAVPIQGHPNINLRPSWGARAPKATPQESPTVRFMVIHHSVTANNYSAAEVPGILRSIQAFHMDGNGWDDIGYNFAVDRYGTKWEGRAGGLDRAVIGAHSFDQNYESSAIVGLGDFSIAGPTNAMVDAYGELSGWKLELHGWNVNNGWDGRPSIVGHRDVNQTACPGQYMYDRLANVRQRAVAKQNEMRSTPGFWTNMTLGRNSDGRLEAFATGNDNRIWHNWESSTHTWSGWWPLMNNVTGGVSVLNNSDQRLEVFAINGTGQLVHMWQIPGIGWSAPASLGGNISPQAGVAVALNGDGRLEAFVLGDDDSVYHIWQSPASPNGWSGFAWLGFGFPSNAGLAVSTNVDKRIEVFATLDGGNLGHAFQEPGTATGFSSFRSLGMPTAGGASATRNADGRLEVFGVDPDGFMWHAWQTIPNGSNNWSGPTPISFGFQRASPVKLVADQGRLRVFALKPNGQVFTMRQDSLAPAGWSGLQDLIGASVFGNVDAAVRSDGRLMVGGIERPGGQRGVMAVQSAPGSSSWSPMLGF